ncbi:hypothetical protein [Bradyrhizobium sp. USDA 4353]
MALPVSRRQRQVLNNLQVLDNLDVIDTLADHLMLPASRLGSISRFAGSAPDALALAHRVAAREQRRRLHGHVA